jgi:hypothetical protein
MLGVIADTLWGQLRQSVRVRGLARKGHCPAITLVDAGSAMAEIDTNREGGQWPSRRLLKHGFAWISFAMLSA